MLKIDTINHCGVRWTIWPEGTGALSGKPAIGIHQPPQAGALITSEQALLLAAWLVALADGPALAEDETTPLTGPGWDKFTRFDQVLAAVKGT